MDRKALADAVAVFGKTYQREADSNIERRAQAFYHAMQMKNQEEDNKRADAQLQMQQEARQEASANNQAELAQHLIKLHQMADEFDAAAKFQEEHQGQSLESWKLMTEEQKFNAYMASQKASTGASLAAGAASRLAAKRIEQLLPYETEKAKADALRAQSEATKSGVAARIATSTEEDATLGAHAEGQKKIVDLEAALEDLRGKKNKNDSEERNAKLDEQEKHLKESIQRVKDWNAMLTAHKSDSGELPADQALRFQPLIDREIRGYNSLLGEQPAPKGEDLPDVSKFARGATAKEKVSAEDQVKADQYAAKRANEEGRRYFYVSPVDMKLHGTDDPVFIARMVKNPHLKSLVLSTDRVHTDMVGQPYHVNALSPIGADGKYVLPEFSKPTTQTMSHARPVMR